MVKIIAELSINHLGMKKIAIAMMEECAKMGVDYIKFKKKDVASYYKSGKDFKGYDFKKYRGSFELSEKDFEEIDLWCSENEMKWFSTIHGVNSFNVISSFDVPFYKIASSDALDDKFIEWYLTANKEKKPTIVSTGGMDIMQIDEMARLMRGEEIPLIINHCVSIYPTPIEQTNIGFIKELQSICGVTVGYSGHEEGWIPTLLAVQMGVEYVERHLTLSRDLDIHHINASLTVDEFSDMVNDIRDLEKALDSGYKDYEEMEFNFLKERVYE